MKVRIMDKSMTKWMTFLWIVLLFLTVGPVQAQGQAAAPALPAGAPPVTAAQAAAAQSLTPAQQSAVMQEVGKTGGQLTPGAVEALKARPEFQNLSPAEVAKGKELLQQQEAAKQAEAKKEPAKKEAEPVKKKEEEEAPKKQVIGGLPKGETLFERARATGKYQDISLDLRPFGYDFFRDAAVKVITDSKNIPIPLKYMVGPGDEVRITMWGRANASYNLAVDRDGKIAIPNIGPLTVAGMTFEQMSAYLIKQAEQITGTNVDISMGALRTMPIFILGDVRRAGAYTIGSFATITDALLLSGGPTEIGSMRNVQLKRKDKVIQTFDLYDLLLKGDKSKDVILQAGDIVFVPVIGTYVGVAGNVKRPALYELRDNFSLEYLFDLAGGIIPT
ncbi:MAG: polysaccharide biosynthesis/export family protein, partial [Pseudomonadota bacterium]